MFDIVLLNVVFIILPIVIYLLYIVYENVIGIKGKDLFFNLAIFTSIYLIVKYSLYFDYSTDIIKVLLLVCMIKKKIKVSILVALFLSVYFSYINNYDFILILLKNFIQLSLFFMILRNIKLEYKIIIFLIIEIVCGMLFNGNLHISIITSNVFYVFAGYAISIFMGKIEKIIDIYGTIKMVEYEKEFRNSLFEVTHEIKNPIAVCKGYLDMMDVENKKQVEKYFPIIKQEINRTLTIMTDFLNLTKLSVNKNIIDIALLLDDVSDVVDALTVRKDIHFVFDIPDEEVFIEGDYDRLKQVFINLIKNSIESIESDKIGVIKLNLDIKNKVVITLSDNGIGMNKETLEKIGESFYTTKEKGTGLGVKLSMEIIELHDGKIKYNSKLNEGTIVKIELPLYK